MPLPAPMRVPLPLTESLVDELLPFWAAIFGEGLPDFERPLFLGSEIADSRGTLYLQRIEEQVAATCFMLQAQSVPALAGFGEVATAPQFRGRGLATALCRQAVADFRAAGGQAFFLGTVNPVAARVYQRLGWRKLAGATVMVNLTAVLSPEEFLVDYFRQPGSVEIRRAGPAVRVPMIPLILTPHESELLDANVGLYSCRYRTQHSCMGLYPRYVRALQDGQGAWFAATTTDGRVVGLATAKRIDAAAGPTTYQIDGFTHHRFTAHGGDLLQAACTWACHQGATTLQATIAAEDERKQSILQALGFVYTGVAPNFDEQRLTVWRTSRG